MDNGQVSKNYFDIIRQYWSHSPLPKEAERLFTLAEVTALEQAAVAATEERIIQKLLYVMSHPEFAWNYWLTTEDDLRRFLSEGENK